MKNNSAESFGPLHEALQKALAEIPRKAFCDLIAGKVKEQGIALSAKEIEGLFAHIQSGNASEFKLSRWRWRWWENRIIPVKVTEEESDQVIFKLERFIEKIPALIQPLVNDLSQEILKPLRRNWPKESMAQARERREFEMRLEARWGPALDKLRMLIALATEFGGLTTSALLANGQDEQLVSVLSRLHARSCQVANEIHRLLSAGYADGAMARWRTLHEIAVTAFVLKEYGNQVVRRYLDHEIVESYKATVEYQVSAVRLNAEPMSESEVSEMHRAYEDVRVKYGAGFTGQYGWAAEIIDAKEGITFRAIEKLAQIDHLRPFYRMASHNVHANPKGVFSKLGLMGAVDVLLAGPSNAGLADPGASAGVSLLQVSTTLGSIMPTVDVLVGLNILKTLEMECQEAFMSAHQKLVEDENALHDS